MSLIDTALNTNSYSWEDLADIGVAVVTRDAGDEVEGLGGGGRLQQACVIQQRRVAKRRKLVGCNNKQCKMESKLLGGGGLTYQVAVA